VHAKQRSSDHHNYVKKMTVSLNGHLVITVHYKDRHGTEEFLDNAILKAKEGDVISAVLYSSEGGNKSLNLNITDAEISEARSSQESFSESTAIGE